jgi:hypothetical protein
MYDWSNELTDEVVLAHPSRVRVIAEVRIKTDKIDSEILAYSVRADLIPKAYAPSKDVRAVKRVLTVAGVSWFSSGAIATNFGIAIFECHLERQEEN